MSNDRYQEIRDALAMGPTPGPWSVRYDYVVQSKSFDEGRLVPIAQPYGLRVDGSDLFANAALIAACNPDTIRELLAERDQLAAAIARARAEVERLQSDTSFATAISSLRRGKERAERLAEALRGWWKAHRPVGWTEDQHRSCPHVNLATDAEKALATALLREQEEGNGQ